LLVECKQRQPNIRWLFFPNPNRSSRHALYAEDKFSQLFFPNNVAAYFDQRLWFCYKGIEIDESKGNVYDTELKHGISQLQYALPRLYTERVYSNAQYDFSPFLFCSILLTTANLFVANNNLITSDIETAAVLKDIAHQVPYLIFTSDYGPDFEEHCRKECASLAELPKMKFIKALDNYRRKKNSFDNQLPSVVATSIAAGEKLQLQARFTHFVVCTMKEFPSLITHIKRSTTMALRTMKSLSR